MATRYQRQRAMDTSMSSYSRDSFTPTRERASGYTHTRSYTRSTRSAAPGVDLANMCKYHSSAPVRYSIHPKFQSRFLWRNQNPFLNVHLLSSMFQLNSVWFYLFLSGFLTVWQSDCLTDCLSVSLSDSLAVWQSDCLTECLNVWQSGCLTLKLSDHLILSDSIWLHLLLSDSVFFYSSSNWFYFHHFCHWLSVYFCLTVYFPTYLYLILSQYVHSCLFQSIPVYSSLFLSISVYALPFLPTIYSV